MNAARHVIQDSEDEAESNGEDDNDNDDNEEDASESYARLKADRLAEGCNRKVRKLFAFRFPSTQCSLLFQPSRKHQHRGHDKRTEDIRAMFTKGMQKSKADGSELKGHLCDVCK